MNGRKFGYFCNLFDFLWSVVRKLTTIAIKIILMILVSCFILCRVEWKEKEKISYSTVCRNESFENKTSIRFDSSRRFVSSSFLFFFHSTYRILNSLWNDLTNTLLFFPYLVVWLYGLEIILSYRYNRLHIFFFFFSEQSMCYWFIWFVYWYF